MRKTTTREDKDFVKEMVDSTLLEKAGEYISENFLLEDVYSEDQLREWAIDHGFVEKKVEDTL